MSNKMREALEACLGALEAIAEERWQGTKVDEIMLKAKAVLDGQQPESEPAVSCSYGQNCEHCEPGHGCRPDRPESEPAACFIMSDSGWPMAVCYDRDMMARLQKDSGGLTIKWLHEHSRPSAQVPDGIKRYDISSDAFSGDMEESATGSWVRLADVKESLTASPSIAEKLDLDADLFIIDGMDHTEEDEHEIAMYHSECLPLNSSNIVTVERWHKLPSRNMKVSVDAEARVEWEWVDSPLTGAE